MKEMRARSLENVRGCAVSDGMVSKSLLDKLTDEQRMRGDSFRYLSGRGQRQCKGPEAGFYLVCEKQWRVQCG